MAKKKELLNPPNRLRALREAAGLSLHQVEELSGIHFSNLGKLETGERDMRFHHMKKLAKAYGVLPADLLNAEDGGLPAPARALTETYQDIPEAHRRSFDALRESHQVFRGQPEVVPLGQPKDDERKSA